LCSLDTITRVENEQTYSQTFDIENRLSSVTVNGQATQFIYDGDGNLVKKIKPDGSKTLYIAGIYEVDKTSGGSVTRTVTYYPVSGAMRINSTLYYLLKDHLGSASVMTDASGTTVGEDRFYPYGETRFTTGTMYTDQLFTGQREMTGLGIYHYGARFYSPKLGRFLSADTIVQSYANPQTLNRYSYVLGNPLKYTDPTGHVVACNENDGDVCEHEDSGSSAPPLLVFSNDEDESFTSDEIQVLTSGASAVAQALAREMNALCDGADRKLGECTVISPQEAFYAVFGGAITVRRVGHDCDCWAEMRGKINGHYEIWVYHTASEQEILNHPNLIVHEIGHAFQRAAGGLIGGSDVGDRNGFYGPRFSWQFGLDDSNNEIFADMFVGWVFGKWESGNLPGGFSINGQAKSDYMNKYMPLMIDGATGR
jgi:RHS repeat-associated protein